MATIGPRIRIYSSLRPHVVDTPQGLRWQKADSGQPVTWNIDFSNYKLPFPRPAFENMVLAQTKKIMSVCSIILQKSTNHPDIIISFQTVDGLGGTLGFAYTPSKGTSMAVSGPLSGDIVLDNAETDMTLPNWAVIVRHELTHSCGVSEHDGGIADDLMDPYFNPNLSYDFGPYSLSELRKRYPV